MSGAKLVGRSGQNVFISQHGHFQVKTADKKNQLKISKLC